MFFRTKTNINKCEIAGWGILKGAQETVCGLQNIDFANDSIKILGIHFSDNKKNSDREKLFNQCQKNSKKTLNVWITRTLVLEGKILIFKALRVSRIVYLSLIITIANSNLILEEIQKTFLW